jgi:hypothetical protein
MEAVHEAQDPGRADCTPKGPIKQVSRGAFQQSRRITYFILVSSSI